MLTEEKVAEVKEAFAIQDVENVGKVIGTKVMAVLRTLGHDPTKSEVRDLLNEIGKTEEEMVTFIEVLNMYERKAEDFERCSAARIAFRMFDNEEKGYITPEDVVRVTAQLGSPIGKEKAEELVRKTSVYGYRKVNFEEFLISQMFA
jgi:Ca2+-binding EF-hand superfamily protein